METIQVVLERALLQEADRAARRHRLNRSALIREALRAHLRRLATDDRERRDRAGYVRTPVTSSIRSVPSEVAIGPDHNVKQPSAVNLHNVLTIQKSHIGRRVARLSDDTMREVCRAIAFVVGCES